MSIHHGATKETAVLIGVLMCCEKDPDYPFRNAAW